MKRSLRYLFLFPIVALAIWIGISHLYIAGNLFDEFTTTRGTYIYLITIPSLIKKVPEVGIVGKAEFSSWSVDGTKAGGDSVSYKSIEQPQVIVGRIQEYLIEQGYAPCQAQQCLYSGDSKIQVWVPADPNDPRWVELAVIKNEHSTNTVFVSYLYF